MAKLKTLRLRYAPAGDLYEEKAQPCVVVPKYKTQPFRVVPIAPIVKEDGECIGCVGEHNQFGHTNVSCDNLPDCANTIYVRATPANKLKHIEWLLECN